MHSGYSHVGVLVLASKNIFCMFAPKNIFQSTHCEKASAMAAHCKERALVASPRLISLEDVLWSEQVEDVLWCEHQETVL